MSFSAERARPAAIVFGCAGAELGRDERALFAEADPLGFILFARNCREPAQLRDLVAALRDSVGRRDAPVLIDQEGGRVQRLAPPHWRRRPPWRSFGDMAAAEGLDRAVEAAGAAAREIAGELAELGIDVNCLPLLDVPAPGGHAVIGDRAFSRDPATVAALGRAVCEGLLAGGVVPVVKHMPGHGRAAVDSHLALPVVEAPADELAADFAPFRALRDMPWAMTAHVVYTAFDASAPATQSRAVVAQAIRGSIGFDWTLSWILAALAFECPSTDSGQTWSPRGGPKPCRSLLSCVQSAQSAGPVEYSPVRRYQLVSFQCGGDDYPIRRVSVHIRQESGTDRNASFNREFSQSIIKQLPSPREKVSIQMKLALLYSHPDFPE